MENLEQKLEKLNKKIKVLKLKRNQNINKTFNEDLKNLEKEVQEIKTFQDFNKMLEKKDRQYTEFFKTDFRKEKSKDKQEPLTEFLNIRISEKDKDLIKILKSKKINVSSEVRNFLQHLNSEIFYELHLEKIKLKQIEIKKIENEIRKKVKILSELLFKEFNKKNAEERYKIKFEIRDLQIKKYKVKEYLNQFKN